MNAQETENCMKSDQNKMQACGGRKKHMKPGNEKTNGCGGGKNEQSGGEGKNVIMGGKKNLPARKRRRSVRHGRGRLQRTTAAPVDCSTRTHGHCRTAIAVHTPRGGETAAGLCLHRQNWTLEVPLTLRAVGPVRIPTRLRAQLSASRL